MGPKPEEDEKCPICLDPLEDKRTLFQKITTKNPLYSCRKCKHTFHRDCVEEYIRECKKPGFVGKSSFMVSGGCPLCRMAKKPKKKKILDIIDDTLYRWGI